MERPTRTGISWGVMAGWLAGWLAQRWGIYAITSRPLGFHPALPGPSQGVLPHLISPCPWHALCTVTLNPLKDPAPDKTYRRLSLAHPVFSFASVQAQQRLPEVNGAGGIWLAGAWAGHGFHEDGIRAAVAAVHVRAGVMEWVQWSRIGWCSLPFLS